ncbi:MAG: hypothetical protein AB8E15_11130 [Bdellovibrionales bacterium]
MSYSHYNKHLSKISYGRSIRFFTVMLLSFLYQTTQIPNIQHRFFIEPIQIKIPKVSLLASLTKDFNQEYDFKKTVFSFPLKSEVMESDYNYQRPTIKSFDEGLIISKEEFIIGDHRFFSEEKALKLSKIEATLYSEVVKSFDDKKAKIALNDWVAEENKRNILQTLAKQMPVEQFNRLYKIPANDLDKVLQEDFTEGALAGQINKLNGVAISNVGDVKSKKEESWNVFWKPRNSNLPAPPQILASNDTSSDTPSDPMNRARVNKVDSFYNKTSDSGVYPMSFVESLQPASEFVEPDSYKQKIKGRIYLHEGLALLGNEGLLDIYRVRDEQTFESAFIDFSAGVFDINLEENIGILVAELRDLDGLLIGMGEINLSKIKNRAAEGITESMHIYPVEWGLVASVKDNSTQQALRDVQLTMDLIKPLNQTDKFGKTYLDKLSYYSNFLLSAQKTDFWKSQKIASAHKRVEFELMGDQVIYDLKEILRDQNIYMDEGLSIVWGKLENRGSPIKNAKVEITDANAIGPIYLNDFYLPDVQLNQSSHSGQFIFINVEEGVHQVRLQDRGSIAADVVLTENETISLVSFDTGQNNKVKVSLRDWETNEFVPAEFQVAGTEDLFVTDLMDEVSFTYLKSKSLHTLEIQPIDDYLATRWNFSHRVGIFDSFGVPSLKKSVLEEAGISLSDTLLLIPSDASVDIGIDHYGIEDVEIFYVGEDGSLSLDETPGFQGRLVVGSSEGLHSLNAIWKDSKQISNQLFLLSKGVLTVVFP